MQPCPPAVSCRITCVSSCASNCRPRSVCGELRPVSNTLTADAAACWSPLVLTLLSHAPSGVRRKHGWLDRAVLRRAEHHLLHYVRGFSSNSIRWTPRLGPQVRGFFLLARRAFAAELRRRGGNGEWARHTHHLVCDAVGLILEWIVGRADDLASSVSTKEHAI
jgi:hypothetical protein